MPLIYQNGSNRARSSSVGRADLVGEAGEIFTPPDLVKRVLEMNAVKALVENPDAMILEPAAGDGNFICSLLERRIRAGEAAGLEQDEIMESLRLIYSIEILEDNHGHMADRVKGILVNLLNASNDEAESYIVSNILLGNYLTARACSMECLAGCTTHEKLKLPEDFALTVGNPPYNPRLLYQDFLAKALAESATVAFIIPTAWKLSPRHRVFRATTLDRISSVDDLPWSAFKIKMRTSILIAHGKPQGSLILNGRIATPAGTSLMVGNSIMEKIAGSWPNLIQDHRSKGLAYSVSFGWKCNVYRDKRKVSFLQSVGYDPQASGFPRNIHTLSFNTEGERTAFVEYSATKLAAYLQRLTESDRLSLWLPCPDFSKLAGEPVIDSLLYSQLGLSEEEIKDIEENTLVVSAKAAEFYGKVGVPLRSDAIFTAVRPSCPGCGSSSFHRKGCPMSTAREKSSRDGTK